MADMQLPGIPIPQKPLALHQLADEMRAAGLNVPMLGTNVSANRLFTFDTDGVPIDLPTGFQPVIDAHVPPAPISYGADGLVDRTRVLDAVTKIRQYQGLAAGAVTQVQRKQYEDLIGDALIALVRRVVGSG